MDRRFADLRDEDTCFSGHLVRQHAEFFEALQQAIIAELQRREASTPLALLLYWTHTGLQAVGVVWDPADWLDAALYALEGKWGQVRLSLAASLAGFGVGMVIARWANVPTT